MYTAASLDRRLPRKARRAVLLGVDGLRPDPLRCAPGLRALAGPPHIGRLIAAGAYCDHAQSVKPPISLPCWLSVMNGTPPQQHGTLDNLWTLPAGGEPIPSLFDLAHQAGLGTASFYNWEQLRDLARPGALDRSFYCRIGDPEGDSDLEVAAAAADSIAAHRPELAFVYFGAVDEVAHLHGWMSAPYLEAIRKADRAIGLVLAAMEAADLVEGTALFVLADHGGEGTHHGQAIPANMTVPWIASGAGICRGHRIAGPVSIIDTAPTVARLLGLTPPAEWTGRVIAEALAW